MAMNLAPHIAFKDNAQEALTFYQTIFGGTVTISTFGEFEDGLSAEHGALVMHGELETDAGFVILAADTPAHMTYLPGAQISLAVFGQEEDTMAQCYQVLADQGGRVEVPLEKAPWGDSFGMLVDKYGVKWMFNIAGLNHTA